MTSGQYGGRDYGRDYHAAPPRHPERNGYSGYGQRPGYSQPEHVNGAYAAGDYRSSGYGEPGYPEPGQPYSDPAYPRYQDPSYRDTSYLDRSYQDGPYQDPTYQDREYDGLADRYRDDGYRDDDYRGRSLDDRTVGLSRRRPGNDRPADGRPEGSAKRKRRGLPLWQELPLLLIIAFCLAILVRTFLLQAFYIPSGSMEDTLIAGDRVLVNKLVYKFRDPARGEVVVFRGTDAWAPEDTGEEDIGTFASIGRTLGDLVGVSRPGEKDFIKRVIGLPGDTVSCCSVDGQVFVNGQPLDEPYVIRDSPLDENGGGANDCRSRQFDEVVVQPGHMFVMGDHRLVSQDSRCQGQVPIENVIGRAFVIVWPNNRWGSLSQPDTFANVPPPATTVGSMAPLTEPAGPPAELAFVLPILLPMAFASGAARRRSRIITESIGAFPDRRVGPKS